MSQERYVAGEKTIQRLQNWGVCINKEGWHDQVRVSKRQILQDAMRREVSLEACRTLEMGMKVLTQGFDSIKSTFF